MSTELLPGVAPKAVAPNGAAPVHPALADFHPIVAEWFAERLGEPTEPQVRGWPLIRAGTSVLISSPTGSGKTLAAFLACIDELVHAAERGTLTDATHILYVSPLKALGNDVRTNLLGPLEELAARARARNVPLPELRVGIRTGDTTPTERAALVARPPHILITTPESLYLYLTANGPRATLATVRTVVVDELHALARDKRGSHFALSLERLRRAGASSLRLIGLSATSRPLDELSRFLVGARQTPLEVVEVEPRRVGEFKVETPDDELTAVASNALWERLYERITTLSADHRTMLVFTNTRRLAERVAHELGQRLGPTLVAAHHGSLAKEIRLSAEQRLKRGELKVLVATASLELGIDIGSIDYVVQIGSPRSISVMLQRFGRSGHHKTRISKGSIIALTRDELLESAALLWAIRDGELDLVRQPKAPLDVLGQQLVAEVAAGEASENELYECFTRAAPYAELTREEFEKVVVCASEGPAPTRGRGRAHLHRDQVHGMLRPRRSARLMALQNGGAIPDLFTYPVIAEPEDKQVGTVDEDWAVESMAGDIFVLGSTSWKIRRIGDGVVRVENAHGQPPSIPFWRGEAPGRTDELSRRVAALRERLDDDAPSRAFLTGDLALSPNDADFLCRYVAAGRTALGAVPTQTCVIAERFFDDAGGMQLIIHAPFGARINRAWGMALRKCFCRAFDFELQAAASDDGILLSLGEQHSFPLLDIFDFVSPASAERVLVQAILQAPLFGTRFRWTAGRALSLARQHNGRRVPPPLQRARAEDLIAAVFPEQVGCQDNHGGAELVPPDHPLISETLDDCLRDFMDIDGLVKVLNDLSSGRITKLAVDTPEPSVFAHQLLNSAPYTFLDEAPLEERRARAVATRRTLPQADAAVGALDASAIEQVRADAAPLIRSAEELHDTLLQLVLWPHADEGQLEALRRSQRADIVVLGSRRYAYPAERASLVRTLWPDAQVTLESPPGIESVERDVAARRVVQGWLEILGPVTASELALVLSLPRIDVEEALARIEASGQVLRGHFRPEAAADGELEWCDRRLLQRIHRLTVGRLRKEIEPLSGQDYMRFLFRWHFMDAEGKLRGTLGLAKAVALLEGHEAPAAAWESELFPARVRGYLDDYLTQLCSSGEVVWGRLSLKEPSNIRSAGLSRAASLTFARRAEFDWMLAAARGEPTDALPEGLSPQAQEVYAFLAKHGASFFGELVNGTRRLPAEVEGALAELLALGLTSADAVHNLRVLQSPVARRRQQLTRRGGPGRWALLAPRESYTKEDLTERAAELLLNRYGIVFRDVAQREPLAPSWSELLRVYRRREMRGEVRGGRFLAGLVGEQFALPGAVELSRVVRRTETRGEVIRIAAVDPLNLTGIVTPGRRVPAMPGLTVTYRDGVPELAPVPERLHSLQEVD